MKRVLLLTTVTVLLLFVVGVYGQPTPPPAPVWPLQWHADVVVADAGLTPNAKSLSVLYEGQYYYNYSSAPVITYFLTHRYSTRIEKEVIFSNGGDAETAYVVDYSSGSCSAPLIIKDRWQIFTPNLIARNGFKFIGYDYLLNNEGNAFLETSHWSYSTLFGTVIEYWHATATNSPFRISWSPITGNPAIIQFSNFVSSFADIPNPSFYFHYPSPCNSLSSNRLNSHELKPNPKLNSIQNSILLNTQKRTTANPWPDQWTALARFTGNAFGQQNLSPITIPLSLSGRFYFDFTNSRECNIWTDLSTASRTKTLIVNSTFHYVDLSTNFCLTIPILPVSGPLKPNWPVSVPYINSPWLYVRDTRAFIETEHFRIDALNAGENNAFNYWQSSNGTPRLFEGPVLDKAPYGVSLMEWEGVEKGLAGVDVDSVFSVPKVCPSVGGEAELKGMGLEWVGALANYHRMQAKMW